MKENKKDTTMTLEWSAWQFDDKCEEIGLSNGSSVECGHSGEGGKKTRTRNQILDGEVLRMEVEEIACPSCADFRQINDVCLKYQELNSSTRRSNNSEKGDNCDKWLNSKGALNHDKSSDWLGRGWYRITGEAGSKLVDSEVDELHCGTFATGWMEGGHPTFAEGEVRRTVHFPSKWNGIDFGKWSANVKVVNCRTHYVYYLVDTPNCSLGYCTEC